MRWMRSTHRKLPIAAGTVPANFGGGGVGGRVTVGTRLATKPLFCMELSDVNVTVREPLVDVTGAGMAVPEKLPSEVELAEAPSYRLMRSQQLSVLNSVNCTVIGPAPVTTHVQL